MRAFIPRFSLVLSFVLAIDTAGQFKMSDMENRAQFVEHFQSMLSIGHSPFFKVHDSMACILECLRSALCYSVNFAVESDGQRNLCELLPADEYQFSEKFEPSVSPLEYWGKISKLLFSLSKASKLQNYRYTVVDVYYQCAYC